MATQSKKPFKLNVLGLLNLETEDLTFNQKLIILIAVMLFMIVIVALLKAFAIPALSLPGFIKKAGSIKNIFKSRSPWNKIIDMFTGAGELLIGCPPCQA